MPADTVTNLEAIGVRIDEPRIVGAGYGDLPLVETVSNWKETNALFKYEKGYVNIGLGNGTALDIWT